MSIYHFIEPLDVLFLRGNKLFGDPGSYGESLMPPWPSVAAGAIRSMLLARSNTDIQAFARGEVAHPELGTSDKPGSFRLLDFLLARCGKEGTESLHVIPADLVVAREDDGALHISKLTPRALKHGVQCSSVMSQVPVLAEARRSKPASGHWLTQEGFARYLAGETPTTDHLVESSDLWQMDERVGVGLDPARRCAGDGNLFTIQAVAFCQGVGFLATTEGADLPKKEMLRLGGDGRAAALWEAGDFQPPTADLKALTEAGRCRIVLTSPGLFPDGWRLPGMDENGTFDLLGISGKVMAAALPRAETVSGWDLARRQPKPARRAASAGSVYWIEELEANVARLDKLEAHGLWPESGYDAARQVEGFNRFQFATY